MFSENKEKYLGYGESAAGLGLMVGPLISGIINEWFGYFPTFLFFGIFIGFMTIVNVLLMPKCLNEVESSEPAAAEGEH